MEFTVIKQILKSPKSGWQILPDAISNRKLIGLNILITVAILAGSLSFIGVYLNTGGSFLLAIQYFAYIILKWTASIYFASWALSKLIKGSKGHLSFWLTLAVLAICTSFLMVFTSISHIVSFVKIPMYLLSILGLVYYYFALEKLAGLNKEQLPGFLIISLLVVAIILFFIELLLAIFFNIPFNL
ncbi:MAG: hypothetical protein WC951_09690 [Bacteroidales bacterium]|nr:hypothetical protein [Tenuifilaceae bacterium]